MSKVTIYSPPSSAQIKHCAVDFDLRREPVPVHLVQYDKTLPILEVSLYKGGAQYRLPEDAEANVRMGKFNNRVIYNPVLGCGENRDKVYIAVTQQMTTQEGDFYPIVEVLVDGGVAGTSSMRLVVHRNPAQENAIKDSSEAKSLDELVKQAAASAESARNDAEIAKQAEQTVEANAGNIQAVVDNLDAIKAAPGQAQAAAASAAAAQKAAQEALGFRTFFSAITPDANGALDPSRPMTTPSAQSSWTIESKGDRIQSVQVNGATADGQNAGTRMVEYTLTGSEDYTTVSGWQPGSFSVNNFFAGAKSVSGFGTKALMYCNQYKTATASQVTSVGIVGVAQGNGTTLYINLGAQYNLDTFKQKISDLYNAGTPIKLWAEAESEETATGLYIPIQAQGHEYRCQCLPISEALGAGDNVQSNAASGCDKVIAFDGSEDESWALDAASTSGVGGSKRLYIDLADSISNTSSSVKSNGFFNYLIMTYTNAVYDASKENVGAIQQSTSTGKARLFVRIEGISGVQALREHLSANHLILTYRSVAYSEQNDKFVELETHANGNVYAHPAVELVAVPYTDADSGHTPGTYDVSSQNGTTVSVSLKPMQDGGNAAMIAGHTWEDIQKLISDAVTAAVQMAKA